MQYVRELLGKLGVDENGKADRDVLMEFVDTVTVEKGNVFKWGLRLRNKPSYLRMTASGRGENMTASAVGAETSEPNCHERQNAGQSRSTPLGCEHHRRISKILVSNISA